MYNKKSDVVDFIISLILLVPGFFIGGWTLSTIWNFWIYPVFGICLNVFSGGGISMFMSFISIKLTANSKISSNSKKNDDISGWMISITIWVAEIIIVFVNWIMFLMFGQFV